MTKRTASERHFDTRLKCVYYLLKAGSLPDARTLARKSPERFGASSGPWLTALGLMLEFEMKGQKLGYFVLHKECLYPVIEVAKDDLGCVGCFKHNLEPGDLKKMMLK